MGHTIMFLHFDISTHAPRTGSDIGGTAFRTNSIISTHAPRTGSDIINNCTFETIKISTHAPRTGSDHRPVRTVLEDLTHFNPRSPHGERPVRRRLI